MRITVLTENTAQTSALTAEHGLSLYMETGGRRILFDMGQSDAFAANAARLGIDLTGVELAVLSHGHYDHGGGMAAFMAMNKTAPVYLSRHAFGAHYNGTEKYIGLTREGLDPARLRFASETEMLAPGVTLYACTGARCVYPVEPFGLCTRENGRFVPEQFRHEQYLLAEEAGRRILISGCSHRGIRNILAWFRPDVLVGGFHLMKLDPADDAHRARLDEIAADLLAYPTMYYTGHCTGTTQYDYLKNQMGDRLEALYTGRTVEI